jgi:hypothetical protein
MSATATPDILTQIAAECYGDPLGWVQVAFPWGRGQLEQYEGPDSWQEDFLEEWGELIRGRGFDGSGPVEPIRMSRSSGHGIGKSALMAWINLFLMSTRPQCKGTVTANTSPQLETKTWPELNKWHQVCLFRDWFKVSSGRGAMRIAAVGAESTWRIDAQTCAKENSEAFAGQHNAQSSSVYLFDEASAVPDEIWQVAEGGLTDGEPHIIVFGNPTRRSGKFYEVNFGRLRHRWNHGVVNAENVAMTNKELHRQWADDWGKDSDAYRVRVLGLPPQQGDFQFIASDDIDRAMSQDVEKDRGAALVIGVDVARFGSDRSVIRFRRGQDARSIPPRVYRSLDTMQLAARVAEVLDEYPQATCFIDGVGVGGGVVDRLRQLGYRNVVDVNAGARPTDRRKFLNLRAEMWSRMRDWLRGGGCVESSSDLRADLEAVGYGFNEKQQLVIESKEAMRRRGVDSPDDADALALTFAQNVARADMGGRASAVVAVRDIDPFE